MKVMLLWSKFKEHFQKNFRFGGITTYTKCGCNFYNNLPKRSIANYDIQQVSFLFQCKWHIWFLYKKKIR